MQKMSLIVAAGMACSVAMAGPGPLAGPGKKADRAHKAPTTPHVNPEVLGWVENYDSYAAGSSLAGQGGWVTWYGTGTSGTVVDTQAHSPDNSHAYNSSFSDMVYETGYTGHAFTARVWTYVDSVAFGDGYVIQLNAYDHVGASAQWSSQTRFQYTATEQVSNDAAGGGSANSLPIILDRWVEYVAIIDLDNDTLVDYYGGQRLSDKMPTGEQVTWTGAPDPITGGSTNSLISPATPENDIHAAFDMFSNGIDIMYVDTQSLLCYADMDTSTGIGKLDIFDFLKFQDAFVASNFIACDCDRSTDDPVTGAANCDIFDFLCFQDRFVDGCD